VCHVSTICQGDLDAHARITSRCLIQRRYSVCNRVHTCHILAFGDRCQKKSSSMISVNGSTDSACTLVHAELVCSPARAGTNIPSCQGDGGTCQFAASRPEMTGTCHTAAGTWDGSASVPLAARCQTRGIAGCPSTAPLSLVEQHGGAIPSAPASQNYNRQVYSGTRATPAHRHSSDVCCSGFT
jgi:hypothetical protein